MIETALVFDRQGKTIGFFEPPGRSGGSIPDIHSKGDIPFDQRAAEILWYFIMENADRIGGVAHTHPWEGPGSPSSIDIPTFRAIEQHGVGRLLLWPVVTFTEVGYWVYNPIIDDYVPVHEDYITIDIEGIGELRRRSGYVGPRVRPSKMGI